VLNVIKIKYECRWNVSITQQMRAPDMSPPRTFDDNLMGAQDQGIEQWRGGRAR
jgi:hypothetical protein